MQPPIAPSALRGGDHLIWISRMVPKVKIQEIKRIFFVTDRFIICLIDKSDAKS